jgi:hypothetical protein
MDYYTFYDNWEEEIKNLIGALTSIQKMVFAYTCAYRNAPNYHAFAVKETFTDPFFVQRK